MVICSILFYIIFNYKFSASHGRYENISNIQLAINLNYIKKIIDNVTISLPNITIQHNPMINVKIHYFDKQSLDTGLILFIFSFLIIPSSLIIAPLVEEKQNGLKVWIKL